MPSENDYLSLVNAESGDLLAKMPIPMVYRLSRSKFRNLLGQEVHVEASQITLYYLPTY